MMSLTTMYVYYDVNRDIKAITPLLDVSLESSLSSAIFPLSDVEDFLTGKKSTFDYTVDKIEKFSGVTYKISKKKINISYTRTLGSYLSRIPITKEVTTILTIKNNTTLGSVVITIDKEFKEAYQLGSLDDSMPEYIIGFFNKPPVSIHITEKNNPYNLFYTFTFTPQAFLTVDELNFKYNTPPNTSAYVHQTLPIYTYIEK